MSGRIEKESSTRDIPDETCMLPQHRGDFAKHYGCTTLAGRPLRRYCAVSRVCASAAGPG